MFSFEMDSVAECQWRRAYDELASKLDNLLDVFFEYIVRVMGPTQPNSSATFTALMKSFTQTILPTYKYCFFEPFYIY